MVAKQCSENAGLVANHSKKNPHVDDGNLLGQILLDKCSL